MTYSPAFDWLRFVLALVVLLDHGGAFGAKTHVGNLAVHVFFVLSGWLIGGILQQTKREELPRFFFNRAMRIWVPYYLALAVLCALSLARGEFSLEWAQLVTQSLLMVYNLFSGFEVMAGFPYAPLDGTGHHFWSINAEEQFYLGAPLLLVVAYRWGRSPLVWAVLSLAFLSVGCDYPGLAIGVLASILLKDSSWHTSTSGRGAMLALLVCSIPLLTLEVTYMRTAPFFGLAVVMLLSATGTPSPVGTMVGGISYPLYLNHWIGLFAANFVAKHFDIGLPLRLYVAVVVSVALCWMHYRIVDRTIRKHRAQWYSARAGAFAMLFAGTIFVVGMVYGFATVGQIV